MKNIFSIFTILALAIALCLTPAPAVAQTATTNATLSAAMTATTTTVNLTSATGVTGFTNGQPTTWLFIDREFMPVYSISGTRAVVQRNGGGMSTTHASGAYVWIGPYNNFLRGAPAGNCTATNYTYLPMPDVNTGDVWTCANSQWIALTIYPLRTMYGATLTAAATIAPTNGISFITGATTVTTVTPPPAFNNGSGCIKLVPQLVGYFTSTGGNMTKGTTTVVGQTLELCYNATTAAWSASY